MNKIFEGVAGNSPGLNRFDCSYSNIMSCKIGMLYPVQCDEVYPGDVFKMSCFCHCQAQPMVAPIMSDLTIYAHAFFVPFRLLYGVDNSDGVPIWEKFITGGKTGDYDTPLPNWSPTWSKTTFSSETIWDCIGNPVSRTLVDGVQTWRPIVPSGLNVSIAPKYAYNFIYNSFYRDENLVTEVDKTNEDLLNVSFKKDYFTSALEAQQRGTSPALPVDVSVTNGLQFTPGFVSFPSNFALASGTVDPSVYVQYQPGAVNSGVVNSVYLAGHGLDVNGYPYDYPLSANAGQGYQDGVSYGAGNLFGTYTTPVSESGYRTGASPLYVSADGIVDKLSVTHDPGSYTAPTLTGNISATATTFDISDLRNAFAVQRLMELSMRAGYRYTEFIQAHFNASPTDARLDRPEYIGGCLVPINISQQIQSSATSATSPQGNKVGIGEADSIQRIGNYRCLEHGLIMTLISVRPKPLYQQGIDRQWLRQTRFDYYFPEFANLSEQGVYNSELYVGHDSDDAKIFGYQAHWNEMRCKNSRVSGAVREQFDYWTLSRKFGSRPHLNADFITIRDSEFNRAFAVQDEDEFIISWSNIIDAYRPLPAMGVPGLVDHVYGGL